MSIRTPSSGGRPARLIAVTLAPVVGMGLVVATASPASAAVSHVVWDGTNLQIIGDNNNNTISVSCVSGQVQYQPGAIQPGITCATLSSLSVYPDIGTDTVDLSSITRPLFPVLSSISIDVDEMLGAVDTVHGSQIDDVVRAGFYDIVHANAGDDTVIGAGGAVVSGGAGDDTFIDAVPTVLLGGPGDDRFVNSSGNSLDGGAGTDTFAFDFDRNGPSPIELEGHTVGLRLVDSGLHVSVPGSPPGFLPITGVEVHDWTLLRRGQQRFDASAYSGSVIVRGLSGKDTLIGSKGIDVLRGGADADVLDARDGRIDLVDCGAGTDTAYVDAVDQVVGCEKVVYAKPNTSKIKGPGKVRRGAKATYRFSSSVAGSVFQCKLDKKKWKACSSPHTVATGKLTPGKHVLRVRAGYPKGNWDATPSKKGFTVVR